MELTHSLFLHTVVWSPLLSRAWSCSAQMAGPAWIAQCASSTGRRPRCVGPQAPLADCDPSAAVWRSEAGHAVTPAATLWRDAVHPTRGPLNCRVMTGYHACGCVDMCVKNRRVSYQLLTFKTSSLAGRSGVLKHVEAGNPLVLSSIRILDELELKGEP